MSGHRLGEAHPGQDGHSSLIRAMAGEVVPPSAVRRPPRRGSTTHIPTNVETAARQVNRTADPLTTRPLISNTQPRNRDSNGRQPSQCEDARRAQQLRLATWTETKPCEMTPCSGQPSLRAHPDEPPSSHSGMPSQGHSPVLIVTRTPAVALSTGTRVLQNDSSMASPDYNRTISALSVDRRRSVHCRSHVWTECHLLEASGDCSVSTFPVPLVHHCHLTVTVNVPRAW
jgi:hypothetical protein